MKQAQNARKQRGRPAPRKGGRSNSSGGPGNRTENRARGNPKQLLEKYKTQARDALQAGDRVNAEYFFQFADHYQRVVNEAQGNREQQGNVEEKDDRQNQRGRGGRDRQHRPSPAKETTENVVVASKDDQPDDGGDPPVAADPAAAEQPVEVHPELNLDGAEVAEKPKRRAPVRRRRAPKPKEDGAVAAQPKDEGVPKTGGTPEGDEAA